MRHLSDNTSAEKALACVAALLPQFVAQDATLDILPLVDLVFGQKSQSKSMSRAVINFTKAALKQLPEQYSQLLFDRSMTWLSTLKADQRAKVRVSIKDLLTRFIKTFG